MRTVSSCEYAGAQQQSRTSGSVPGLKSLCTAPGGMTTQSPPRTAASSSPSRIVPAPERKK